MCIALPGKLTGIDDTGLVGKVDFQGNIISVMLGAVDARPGDYVLVHAGCAIEVVDQSTAEDLLALYAELEAAYESEQGDAAKDADAGGDRRGLFPLFESEGDS